MHKILLTCLNNKFFIGGDNWFISFNKQNQEIFTLLKNYQMEECLITIGPGSFIGTRSVASFILGFTLYTSIPVKGFNILVDLIPFMATNTPPKEKLILYFFQELNRFFYCIYAKDLEKRDFFLLSLQEFLILKKTPDIFTIGNDPAADEYILIDFLSCFKIMSQMLEIKDYPFTSLEYCGKFLI